MGGKHRHTQLSQRAFCDLLSVSPTKTTANSSVCPRRFVCSVAFPLRSRTQQKPNAAAVKQRDPRMQNGCSEASRYAFVLLSNRKPSSFLADLCRCCHFLV